MKRWLTWLCLLVLLPTAALAQDFLVTDDTAGAGANSGAALAPTGDAALDAAVAQLAAGSYLDALNAFAKLGGDTAAKYAAYAEARLLLLRDDPAEALPLLTSLGDFLDAPYRLALCKVMRLHRSMQDGKFGYVDDTGAWRVPPQFDWAERVFRTESLPERAQADAAFAPGDTYAVAAVFVGDTAVGDADLEPATGKYGLLRSDGTLIADTVFDSVLWTKNGYAALADAAGSHLYRIADGSEMGGPYEALGEVSGGYIAAKQNGLWGYLDAATGDPVGDGFVWESAGPYGEGRAAVSQKGLYGYIDTAGKVVIPLVYTNAAPYSEGLAGVRVAKRWGFIDMAGTVVIKPSYAAVGAFQLGLCAVKKGDAWGIINREWQVVLRIKYSEIGPFDPIYHRAWVRQNKLWGMISPEAKFVMEPAWGTHDEFGGNTLCRVSYRGGYGYVDAGGKTRIQNTFAAASPYTADYAAVQDEGGKVRYINKMLRGFTIDTDVPVECRQGFIEARKLTVTLTPTVDATGVAYTLEERHIAYALYDAEGQAVPVAAYAADGV